jgi:glycine/D-amino acid oxidase-like deaminating enzyme
VVQGPGAPEVQAVPEPGDRRSWWLREAFATDPPTVPTPPLEHDIAADVVIIGGGFTGLWTAEHLRRLAPGIDVVVLERDVCGGGASGRNGGLVTGWWDELSRLVDLFGEDEAVRLCRALKTSIQAIGEWCDRHGVDAWYRPGGYMMVAAAQAQEGALDVEVELARQLGVGEELVPMAADEVRARCSTLSFGRGVLMRDGATVQPARLARGLRRVLLERGVRIHEGTAVARLRSGDPCVAETPRGSIRAGVAVAAVNAWGIGWRALRPRVVARGSYITLTEPIPDRLEELRWTGGECFTDMRTAVHYFRTTADGRVAFGGGGASVGVGRRIGRTYTHDTSAVRRTGAGFRRLFPSLADVRLEEAWGGPIDVSPFHLPFFGRIGPGRCFYGLGYTGNGVGPSELGGRILASWVLRVEDDWTSLPIAHYRPLRYPPEPFRSVGAWVVNRAVVRRDRQLERDGAARPLTNLVARLPRRLGYRLPPE